ncbi:unnamed protein product [[Candida] boidinii]|uniref:Unnamed protein product n=1 Tax=Candida boidinii TaxID=5477 RepID=A0A9W6STW9_CANBO|nr:hypothetical protein B5S30_g706 [[Candida] boidinii]GME66644.1 unnamed protein product [[Candida] boidinii]
MVANSKEEESTITAWEYLQNQLKLEKEARELMPYDPDACTYSKGPIRQQVFACLTCYQENDRTPSGVCYSCSIKCHSSHQLVELFTKRNFTCDCGTLRMKNSGCCQLRSSSANTDFNSTAGGNGTSRLGLKPLPIDIYKPEKIKGPAEDIPHLNNNYNQNFKGVFCDCSKPYNPIEETGNMFQCCFGDVCGEDWFHEECIMGIKPGDVVREKANHKSSSSSGTNKLDSLTEIGLPADAKKKEKERMKENLEISSNNVIDISDDEGEDEDEDDDVLPLPGFPILDSFDSLVCWKCVNKYKSALIELKDIWVDTVYHVKAKNLEDRTSAIQKLLNLKNNDEGNTIKRQKLSLEKTDIPFTIFLPEDYKDKLQEIVKQSSNESKNLKYSNLVKLLKRFPFLYLDDPVYEPPEDEDDDDDNSSIFDLGAKALSKMPQEQVLEGVQAYETIKTKLTSFLRPFAEQGNIVTEEEIRNFFSKEIKDK